jgi:diaminopimelate epimerase
MPSLFLTKVTGAGNDFLILDQLTSPSTIRGSRADLARQICHRTEGVGADGLVILEKSETADFRWDFYNSDGSSAEMCGNAARCVAKYYFLTNPQKSGELNFETHAGRILALMRQNGEVEIQMPRPTAMTLQLSENILGQKVTFDCIDTGVPHAVIECKGEIIEQRPLARALRQHSRFGSKGTNVTFFRWTGPDSIEAQTFERGVEDFTQACGTGAVAAALIAARQRPQLPSLRVHMPGGALVVIPKDPPRLIGPAEIIAKVEWLR